MRRGCRIVRSFISECCQHLANGDVLMLAFSISKDDILGVGKYKEEPLEYPRTIQRRRKELETFMESAHKIVTIILKVLGDQLGLKPATLEDLHRIDRTGGNQARITHAPPVASDVITLGEHTGESIAEISFRHVKRVQISAP